MSINRVIIEGYLTRDVEMRATASGLAVAGFTVAVNEKRKNAEGEYVDAPVFVKAVDDLLFYMAPVLGSVLIIAGFVSLLIFTADESGLTGTVEDVAVVHGDRPYSIITIEDADYRFYGDVAPEEGDEIIFTKNERI